MMSFKRQELIQRLKKLALSETPKDLSFGAMCYSPACDDRVIVKIPCDLCGRGYIHLILSQNHPFLLEYHYLLKERYNYWTQTLDESLEKVFQQRCERDPAYLEGTLADNLHRQIIDKYQKRLNLIQLTGLDASLETPEHCQKCGHGIVDQPFYINIRFSDEKKNHRVRIRSLEDLDYFVLFLQNQDRYKSSNDRETALQSRIPQLLRFISEPDLPFLCDLFEIKSELADLNDGPTWHQGICSRMGIVA